MEEPQEQGGQSPKQQVAEKVRAATNVLVTVRTNPTVDELSAAIGLTLMLNKLGKHATAVFSGQIPSTIEFLKPEETIEANTDSLRDFIVSLDKSKADKLRYKVEENVVKIFITPYRTSITQDDLEFTQGDFNVDIVLALGVTVREELDQAITAHGRILHDATVVTVVAGQKQSDLGNINWQDAGASSLSEMLVSISEALQGGLIDSQIATAFLTGIVAETERFSNTKTSPKVMTMAAQLMAAGANQQLIANELEKEVTAPIPEAAPIEPAKEEEPEDIQISEDGSLSISHYKEEHSEERKPEPIEEPAVSEAPEATEELPAVAETKESPIVNEEGHSAFLGSSANEPAPEAVNPLLDMGSSEPDQPETPSETEVSSPEAPDDSILPPPPSPEQQPGSNIHIDEHGNLMKPSVAPKHKVIQPLPESEPHLDLPPGFEMPGESASSEEPAAEEPKVIGLPPAPELPADEAPEFLNDNTTLKEIEENVHSPHLEMAQPEAGLDTARDGVAQALGQTEFDPANQAQQNIGALPLGEQLHPGQPEVVEPSEQAPEQPENPNQAPPVPPPFMGL